MLSGLILDKQIASCSIAPRRTFKNVKQLVKLHSVHDGDTINILTRLHKTEPIGLYPLRVYGIDTPELKKQRKFEYEVAVKIKKVVDHLLRNNIIWVEFGKEECYGRLLGTVYPTVKTSSCCGDRYTKKTQSLGDWLIKHSMANVYYGRGEKQWTTDQLLEANKQCDKYLRKLRPVLKLPLK